MSVPSCHAVFQSRRQLTQLPLATDEPATDSAETRYWTVVGVRIDHVLVPSDFLQVVYGSWRMVKIGGASGGQMTDAEIEAYLCDVSGEVTDRTVAVFDQRTF